ncbi:ATP-binding protein [Kitasatospora sp. NPDC056531]|uniref:ATP-binding protein n=1 Tax=Kitasatospora sp. NPDC056531 TaxID=3345856 RepID=UPI0036B40891
MNSGRRGLVHRIALNAASPCPKARLECVGPARDVLRSIAESWGITGGALDDVLTVAYELIVNAVRHTPPGRLPVSLRLSPDGRRLMVEVHDLSRRLPRIPTGAFADDGAESGRGLLIVSALAEQWGATLTADGKIVWVRIALPIALPVPALARATHRALVVADVVRAARTRAVKPNPFSPLAD